MYYHTPHSQNVSVTPGEYPKPDERRLTEFDPNDRDQDDASRNMFPEKWDSILREANGGDPRRQARVAMEIEEKDWDAIHALQTRRNAPLGLSWDIVPPAGYETDATAKRIADEARKMVSDLFEQTSGADLLMHLGSALLPGYACAELVWAPGGRWLNEVCPVDARHVTFMRSKEPLLVSVEHPMGAPLAPGRFMFHEHRSRSGDATRGGLIRPLGWMMTFTNGPVKNLMRFIEKYGMPFVSARIDENAWKNDRNKIRHLVRNFGSDGGAVFTKGVEVELMQAGNTTGDVYFKFLAHMADAKTKVILGQLATSGEGSGFNEGSAQKQVRKDLMESDVAQYAGTLRRDILVPWAQWNYGRDAAVPMVRFETSEPEDAVAKSDVVFKLHQAGFSFDAGWVETTFGVKLASGGPVLRNPGNAVAASSVPGAARAADALGAATVQRMQKAGVGRALAVPLQGLLDRAAMADTPEEAARILNSVDAVELAVGMDAGPLESLLGGAMFAGDVNGRIEAAERIKRK